MGNGTSPTDVKVNGPKEGEDCAVAISQNSEF